MTDRDTYSAVCGVQLGLIKDIRIKLRVGDVRRTVRFPPGHDPDEVAAVVAELIREMIYEWPNVDDR